MDGGVDGRVADSLRLSEPDDGRLSAAAFQPIPALSRAADKAPFLASGETFDRLVLSCNQAGKWRDG